MLARFLPRARLTARCLAQALARRLAAATTPVASPLVGGTLTDLVRSKPALIAENALLRQQIIILRRSVKRPRCTSADRTLLVLLASRVRLWRHALLIVQPETMLRWHRQGFRLFWRRKSQAATTPRKVKVSAETIALIREMAAANRLWGAERIRGELLKVNIRVAKWTIQKYMRAARPPRRSGQPWATFLRTHASAIWACDFLPVTDLLFRQIYAYFIIELATRRVVHMAITRHPTDAWVAQQLREATPERAAPAYLIRDNDSKFGPDFARVAAVSGIEILRTPYRAPRANAYCERFIGSVRRECLDHLLILGETHLRRVLRAYVTYYNGAAASRHRPTGACGRGTGPRRGGEQWINRRHACPGRAASCLSACSVSPSVPAQSHGCTNQPAQPCCSSIHDEGWASHPPTSRQLSPSPGRRSLHPAAGGSEANGSHDEASGQHTSGVSRGMAASRRLWTTT
jgi:transposase InsO family protein